MVRKTLFNSVILSLLVAGCTGAAPLPKDQILAQPPPPQPASVGATTAQPTLQQTALPPASTQSPAVSATIVPASLQAVPAVPAPTVSNPIPATPVRAPYPDLGIAPELKNDQFLNTNQTLRLANLRGQVVMIDFWTFECINCRNVLPNLRAWHDKYSPKGLTIVGIHTPEFAAERDVTNVRAAIKKLDIKYPVAIDNEYQTWQAYNNHYWPAYFLVDKQGHIRYTHIGEGDYAQVEKVIQDLLAES